LWVDCDFPCFDKLFKEIGNKKISAKIHFYEGMLIKYFYLWRLLEEIKALHEEIVEKGSVIPEDQEDVLNHFTCFVEFNNQIVEDDGCKNFPIFWKEKQKSFI